MNPGEKKPNILWICTDQQRFDTLGCYGNKFVSTPNIDRLAAEGVQFSNAISQSPVCSPSRGSFLTGRYPVTCRQRQNGADIPDSEVLVTKLLHDAGYRCGLSGKLHLRACNPSSGCTEMESRIDDGYDEFHWSHDTAPVWGLHNEYYAWLHDVHGTTYRTEAFEGCEHIRKGMPKDLHQTHWCADKAIDFIKEKVLGSCVIFEESQAPRRCFRQLSELGSCVIFEESQASANGTNLYHQAWELCYL